MTTKESRRGLQKIENGGVSTWTQSFLLFEAATAFNTHEVERKKHQAEFLLLRTLTKEQGILKGATDVYQMYHVEAITKTSHSQSANNGTENHWERVIRLIQPVPTALIVSWRAA